MAELVERFTGARNPVGEFSLFFSKNDVPGALVRDKIAQFNASRSPKTALVHTEFRFTSTAHSALVARCEIPNDRSFVEQGRYGLDVRKDGVNNCVSWAARTLNACMGEDVVPASTPSVREIITWMRERKS
jgi:hypothetical protein